MKWIKYTLKTTTQATDLVGDMLGEHGIGGIEVKDNIPLSDEEKSRMFIDFLPELPKDEGVAYVSFYLEEAEQQEERLKEIFEGLEELKSFVDVGECSLEKGETEEDDWINNWKKFFKSFMVENIVIKPTWEELKEEYKDKLVIEIDPGIAFGTGMHETTRLCIKQLIKHVKKGMNVLDIGCGSGILSIAALKLGADTVVGTDIDDNAVKAALENLNANAAKEESFKIYGGNILEDESLAGLLGDGCYDIAAANILADVLIPLSSVVSRYLKIGGLFITSGIINTKEVEVTETIRSNPHFELLEITRENDWTSITAKRVK